MEQPIDLVDCPYCKATGKCEEFFNHYTGEVEIEDCPACEGTKKCDEELATHYLNKNNE